MQHEIFLSVVAAGLAALGTGCSSPAASSTPVYSQAEVGQAIDRQMGEVIGVRDVIITPNSRSGSGTGSRVGAAAMIGAITGSPMAIAGAVGSVMGENGGSKLDNKMGEEITVQLQGGPVIVVVQEQGNLPFISGERVQVVTTGASPYSQKARVVHEVQDASAPIGTRAR